MMPRWAQPGVEVSHISYHSGAGLGSAYSEGRRGKITRVLKTQVEVEFPVFKKDDPKATELRKYKLKRGYKPFGEGNVRVDTLAETGKKWNEGTLAPSNGRFVARLRIDKEILVNSNRMQMVAAEFYKKSAYHIQLADVVDLMSKLRDAAEAREKLEERRIEIDDMPQDR